MEKKHCILYRKIILKLENMRTLGNMLFIRKRENRNWFYTVKKEKNEKIINERLKQKN